MLFNLLMGAMDTAIDALEFGPVKAARINTSFCPQAERDFIRLDRETKEALDRACEEPEEMKAEEKEPKEDISPVNVGDIVQHMEGVIKNIFSPSDNRRMAGVWQIDEEETEDGQHM